ncbi:MAG: ComEC/Rec2 family competence protein [Oscillospiraceae bacterium]|nr:ComEC/Rec2 family competence protein [Oscillospiraceae bacterium]
MKRPLLAVGVSYAIATWASFFLGHSLTTFMILSGVFGFLAVVVGARYKQARLILLAGAVALAAFWVHHTRTVQPLIDSHGREVAVHGIVTAVDLRRMPNYNLTIRATFPEDNLPDTILRVRGWGDLGTHFSPGDGIDATVILEPLLGAQSVQISRGLFVGGRMVDAQRVTPRSLPHRFESFFLGQRQIAVANINANIGYPNATMVAGMALGYLDDLDSELSDALSRAGVIHMVVVSGLHLSILIALLTGTLTRLKVRRVPCALAAIALALGFALLVGFSPSVTRALVMMSVYQLSGIFSRRGDPLNSLGFSLLIVCIIAPHWVLGRGLWLSFCSTAGIIICAGPITERAKAYFSWESRPARAMGNSFISATAATIGAYIFCLPVMVFTSGWLPIISPVVNVLVAPLAFPALVFGLLSAFFTGGWVAPFAWVAGMSARLLADVSRIAASVPLATFALSEFWMLIWLTLASGVAIYLLRKKAGKELWRYGLTLMVLAFAVGSFTTGAATRGRVEVAAIEDVSPIVLLRGSEAVVVGTPTPFELRRISRYLDHRGVRRIETIVAYDQGYQVTSGLISLVEQYEASMVIGPGNAHILGQMQRALPPDTKVFSGEYATIRVLGGVYISPQDVGQVEIRAGRVTLLKSGEEYAIAHRPPRSTVHIWQGGVVIWPEDAPPTFDPLGALLFGERRLVIELYR